VTIQGRGTIDGNGQKWWDFYGNLRKEKREHGKVITQSKWQKMHRELNEETIQPNTWMWDNNNFLRPPLIQFFDSKNIMIGGVTLINSPFWTVNPELCDNLTVTGVTIKNPPESYNTDGINPSSCTNVHISNCHISVGDDCITLKSGRDEDGRRVARPAENITITNCTMLNGHGGVVIGSEMSGCVRKVTISNCVFDGTDRGIRLKSMRGRGGVVEEIRVSNIVMKNIILQSFMMNMYYQESPKEPVSERTPKFRNIHLANVTVSESNQAAKLLGLDEMHIDNITFSNINIESKTGFDIKNVKNIKFKDVTVNTESGPSLIAENITNLEISGFGTLNPKENSPVVSLKNVVDAWVHNANPVTGTKLYLNVDGKKSKNIVVSNNNFINTKTVVNRSKSVSKDAVIKD
jgi:polygalacturonase